MRKFHFGLKFSGIHSLSFTLAGWMVAKVKFNFFISFFHKKKTFSLSSLSCIFFHYFILPYPQQSSQWIQILLMTKINAIFAAALIMAYLCTPLNHHFPGRHSCLTSRGRGVGVFASTTY